MQRVFCATLIFLFLIFSPTAEAMEISAKSAVLIDFYSGEILYQKNAYEKLPMASTTKIMTALCAAENGNLSDVVTVDERAVGIEGSSVYLASGEKITLENLLYALMLSSGNDAAAAVAFHISGSIEAFADLMNKTAQKIGAVNTAFKNPSGLDDENHFTTAYDMALITRYAMQNEDIYKIVSSREKRIPWDGRDYDRILRNHNKLLFALDYCDGVKTGFTKRSGRCLVSSINKNRLRVIAVTLNAPNDWNDHKKMFSYATDNYKAVKVAEKGEYAVNAKIENSEKENIKGVFAKDVFFTLRKDENFEPRCSYEIKDDIVAPTEYGSELGKVTFFVNGKEESVNIISAESAKRRKNTKEKILENPLSKSIMNLLLLWTECGF